MADTLVLFYPLAGRVVTKDGPPRIDTFTEASVDVELAELRTDDFQPQPLLSGLPAAGLEAYSALPQMEGGLPALITQVLKPHLQLVAFFHYTALIVQYKILNE